jgi:hypothetical protein
MKLQQVFTEEEKLPSRSSIVASTLSYVQSHYTNSGNGDSYEQGDFGHSSSLLKYFNIFQ